MGSLTFLSNVCVDSPSVAKHLGKVSNSKVNRHNNGTKTVTQEEKSYHKKI